MRDFADLLDDQELGLGLGLDHDRGARPPGHMPLTDPQGVVTCSHGSHLRFLAGGRYRYFELIRKRLRDVPGRHLHIGALPEPAVAQFRQNLAAEDIDPSRFEYRPEVPSVWALLRDSQVDIVMPPLAPIAPQGFTDIVETMGAGIPMLVHASALANPDSSAEIVYPEVLRWRTPEELVEVLRGLDAPMLQAHAMAARSHYENWRQGSAFGPLSTAMLIGPMPS